MDYLQQLESESIHILREVVASFKRPVILYSIGKDSSVLLHLARKAFFPSRLSVPLLHIDTTWKFQEMIAFRDSVVAQHGLDLIVHTNHEALQAGVSPFTHGARYTDLMKTVALRTALDQGGFDAAIGGARRDEEKSRAKERIFSVRSSKHAWDPRAQRAEVWRHYNTQLAPGQTMRVFPLSNWTELDIWRYIALEQIPVVPLYFAKPRPVIYRSGTWLLVDDERFQFQPGEEVEYRNVRFRTLGCYPLSGAIESSAETLTDIIKEMTDSRRSERQGRLIDSQDSASMEQKKQEGYF